MAKISLREYNRDIEQMINRGVVNEAIAHCKYILRFFPKHIDTYRLLGNAYLESQRYTEAADIMGRVLSVIPDDFIAHVGMSIIREDEKNLDDAIWHMERAYEVQPFNKPVQDELRRLIGQRDGVTPPKVRLTRGALVRMYARGDLLDQAISEARAAIKEDPNRIDLQVLLARLLRNNGQKLEAIETSKIILNKLPFCLEANQILSDLLSSSNRHEDAKIFAQRAASIDPYTPYCDAQYPTSSSVPAEFVTLEQLEYEAGQETAKVPEWTQSVGINWKLTAEDTPGWITDIVPTSSKNEQADAQHIQPFIANITPTQSNQPPALILDEGTDISTDAIPQWMQAAGWSTKKEETTLMDQSFTNEDPTHSSEEILPADIPDWLKDLAPDEPPQPEITNRSDSIDDGFLAALSTSLPAAETETPLKFDEPTADTIISVMNISEQPPSAPSHEISTEQSISDQKTFSYEAKDQPYVSLEKQNIDNYPTLSTPLSDENDIPDWLKDLSAEVDLPIPQQEKSIYEPELATDQSASDNMPDWIKSLAPEVIENTNNIPSSSVEDNESLAWLESLAVQQGVDQATLITKPEDRTKIPPSWIRDLPQESPETNIPESEAMDESVVENTPDTSLSWLETLSEKSEEDQNTQYLQPSDHLVRTEDWLIQEINPEDQTTNINKLNLETSATLPNQKSVEDMNPDEALAWLESLAERQGAEPETLITLPQNRREEPPAWILEETSTAITTIEDEQEEIKIETNAEEIVQPVTAREEFTFIPPPISVDKSEEVTQGTVESAETLPSWMKELLTEEEQPVVQEKSEPVMEPSFTEEISEKDYSSFIPDEEPIIQPASGTQSTEWYPEDNKVPYIEQIDVVEPVPNQKQSPLYEEKEIAPPPILLYTKTQDSLQKGKVEEVYDSISEYIQRGEQIEDIIHDLRDSLVRYPINLSLWQLLGDAYFKNNQLQEALDAYTKAEELLR